MCYTDDGFKIMAAFRRIARQQIRIAEINARHKLNSPGSIHLQSVDMQPAANRYYDLNSYLRRLFGVRVQKITLDAGLTCPNRDGTIAKGGCIYCNQRGSGTGAFAEGLSIEEQLERGRQILAKRYKAKAFIAYFQSFCNTYAPLSHLKHLYETALSQPDVVGISVGTRPDCVDTPVLDLLQSLAQRHLVWVEYGLQSAHDPTLRRINRGHDSACFARAVRLTSGRNIHICAHVILGLPGEDRSHILKTARFLAGLPIDGIKIHLLYVVRGTPLAQLHRNGRYTCLDQETYVEWVCDFLERTPPHVVIQRLTGDPHADELVAPQWAVRKSETLHLIRQTLAKRGTRQGKQMTAPGKLDKTVPLD